MFSTRVRRPGSACSKADREGPSCALLITQLEAEGEVREDDARLAANTLLVLRTGVTIRIEGALTLSRALEVAASLR